MLRQRLQLGAELAKSDCCQVYEKTMRLRAKSLECCQRACSEETAPAARIQMQQQSSTRLELTHLSLLDRVCAKTQLSGEGTLWNANSSRSTRCVDYITGSLRGVCRHAGFRTYDTARFAVSGNKPLAKFLASHGFGNRTRWLPAITVQHYAGFRFLPSPVWPHRDVRPPGECARRFR